MVHTDFFAVIWIQSNSLDESLNSVQMMGLGKTGCRLQATSSSTRPTDKWHWEVLQ